jgi:exosortase/archaeosortase family protein
MLHNKKLHPIKNILWFFVILFGFHFLYSAMVNEEQVIPGLEPLFDYLQRVLFVHSAWVVEHVVGYNIVRQGNAMVFEGGGRLIVDQSCSAVKWFAHFLVLMLLFPGPWKHKLWFIPAGLAVTHLVNVIRITGLAIVFVNRYETFDFFHDYVFRPFFYLVLFLMWVAWVEYFYLHKNR